MKRDEEWQELEQKTAGTHPQHKVIMGVQGVRLLRKGQLAQPSADKGSACRGSQ